MNKLVKRYLKNTKGITLIALIITIIILLILAGVSISALSDNGLFEKAKLAKQKQAEAEVREKINLIVSEYAIEREKGKTLSEFLTEKKDNEEIDDFVDNGDGTFDIIINGYTTTMDENNLSTTEPVISGDIIVTYSAKEFVENKIQTVITVKSQGIGIKEIRLLNNVTVQGNNKNSVAFDHIIEANKEYQIEVELTDGTTTTKTIKYEDTEAPTATIEITNKVIFKQGKIQAKVSIEDNKSGANIGDCKWVVLKDSSTNIGTEDESLYTEIFTSVSQTIEAEEITETGEYYIHLLLKDNVGNVIEVISEKIEIKDGYAISTKEDLQAMGTDLTGHYYVINDIDMTGFEFTPISGTFTGTLDGQGHTISNLYINNTKSKANTGIFRDSKYATFENILFKNVDIRSSSTCVGTLVGNAEAYTYVNKVGITGNLSGSYKVGSFLGNVTGAEVNKKTTFENCYAQTKLTCKSGDLAAGGFVGSSTYYNVFINSYWSGTISSKKSVGTFKANDSNTNQNTEHKPTLTNCYYNSELFTLSVPAKISGTALTTSQFADSSNFTGWDFKENEIDTEYTWYIDTQTGYPELKF